MVASSNPIFQELKKVTFSVTASKEFDHWASHPEANSSLPSLEADLNSIKVLESYLKNWHQRQDRLIRVDFKQIKTGLTHYIQIKVLQLSYHRQRKQSVIDYLNSHILCFYTLAELAYSQSDIESLLHIHQLRLWLLLELSQATQSDYLIKNQKNPTDLNNQLASLRLPWPIDRILTTQMQSTPFLYKEQKRAKEAITALQKNPYQSVAEYFKQKNIFLSPDLKKWANNWTPEYVKMMQTEIFTFQAIKLNLASLIFKQQYGKWPQSQTSLIKEDLIEGRIINPLTHLEQNLPNFK